jgi:hypothetical protein
MMRMAGTKCIGATIALLGFAAGPALAQDEMSEKAVKTVMEYAWMQLPAQYTTKDGKTIITDKKNKAAAMVPLEEAREIIKVGYRSAHAQICSLKEEQLLNRTSLVRREVEKKKWSDQQMLYIQQLHLTTVMLMTGTVKVVEKVDGKDVVTDEKPSTVGQCTDDQRAKVKEAIAAYVKTGPAVALTTSPTATTGSVTPAGAPPAAAPPAEK